MPNISIIVPAYNEMRFIEQTLTRLQEVTRASGISCEIIVVDNGSTDRTASLAEQIENVKVLKLGNRHRISEARNAGAVEAKGALLAFIDADVLVTKAWVDNLHRRFAQLAQSDTVTGAQYRISENPGWIERYWFKAMEERRPNYINGGNVVIGKKLFIRVGGFCADLVTAEDVEFCKRARKKGAIVDPDPMFAVHHEGYPKNLRSFFKRELWTGRGDFSSLRTFVESKTALTAVIVTLLLAASVGFLLFGQWLTSLSLAMIVIAMSMASVKYKYGVQSVEHFLVNTGVMLVHLVARAFAFLSIEKKA